MYVLIKEMKKKLREHHYALTNLQKAQIGVESLPNFTSAYIVIFCVTVIMLVCIILILMRKVKKLNEKLRGWEEKGIVF